uniref:117M18_30 n=1 Tax=Brassica campestris TaxID=3711 RepID=Q4ABZ0_BRACM|nr:117M18_30 [Brassica rapa]
MRDYDSKGGQCRTCNTEIFDQKRVDWCTLHTCLLGQRVSKIRIRLGDYVGKETFRTN